MDSTKSEFRVLDISPSNYDGTNLQRDAIICHLRTISLLDEPEYEALSYVWGSTSGSRDIVVNGTILSVTNNLFEALGYLRDAVCTRTLWIDALCINQKDDAEKNIQVAMMGRIYSQASIVLVWLMKSTLPGLLDDIASFSQNQERHFTEPPSWLPTLSDNDWWHRAWTFQEAALAENLIFHTGTGRFSLKDLAEYCNSLDRHLLRRDRCCSEVFAAASTNDLPIIKLHSAYRMIQDLLSNRQIISQGKKSLLDLVVDSRGRLASRPQDKVYAYLGLACDVPANLVKYELPLREWNLHISATFIQHDMSLKIIRLAGPSGYDQIDMRRMARLSSWCPDWTQTMDSIDASLVQTRLRDLNSAGFTASGQTKTVPRFPRPKILGVSGVVCDTVAQVGHGSLYVYDFNDGLRGLRRSCRLVANSTLIHDAICNGCEKIIYGTRKKCRACPYFDLCSRCFKKSRNIHRDHSFSSIPSSNIDVTEHDDDEPVKDSNWERLNEIAYPFGDGDTLKDALRKVITTEGNIDILFGHSDHGIDGESRDALEIAFAKFWHLKIENRPEADFAIEGGYTEEGYTMEPGSLASRALTEDALCYMIHRVRTLLYKRQLFVSSEGYIGWGPLGMKVGDTIAILHGGDMPFILREFLEWVTLPARPDPDCDRVYSLMLGECYAYGLMRGEALENEEMEKRDFLLC